MMRRRLFLLAIILGGLYLIVVLSRDLWQILGSRQRLTEAEERVDKFEEEQKKLKEELAEVSSDGFLEREAREKLMVGKPGEVMVLLPPEWGEGVTRREEEESEAEPEANWEKWLQLFFY